MPEWKELLMRDHETTEKVFDAGEMAFAAGEPDPAMVKELIRYFVEYVDGCHNKKEENHLFPLLEERGISRQGGPLAARGDGYYIPTRWRDRQRNYGTAELVQILVRVSRRVQRAHRGSLLGMADLSPRGGGPTPEHKSHRSGRDVDLVFFYTDENGKPVRPEEMIEFDKDGNSVQPTSQPSASRPTAASQPAASTESPPPVRKLDVERNWTRVKSLVTDPKVSVQWIFIGRPISRLLLRHARRKKEPGYLVERAATVMHHANGHMDHLHVRIFCDPSDRALGCQDRGPSRWLKKDIKYIDSPPPQPHPATRKLLARLLLRPLRLLVR